MNTELKSKFSALREFIWRRAKWTVTQQPDYVLRNVLRVPFLLKWKEEKVLHMKEIHMIT